MNLVRRIASVSDGTLRRLTRIGVAVLVLGVPAFAVFYYMDQHVDGGPSLADRRLAAAEDLVRKKPDNLTLRLGLAQAYIEVGRNGDALKQYDEMLKAEPGHRIALLGRGDLLRERGDLSAAAAAYEKLIGPAAKGEFAGADTTLGSAYYGLAAVQLAQGRPKEAMSTLDKTIGIESTDADGWYLMGSAALKARAPARAVEAFRRAVSFVPTGWCDPYAGMASAYQALGKQASASYARGMTDFCQGRATDAQRRLTGLTSGPAALDATLGLGVIAETQSDATAAVRWYRRALKLDPSSFAARTGLSRLGQPVPGVRSASPTH